MMAVEDEVEASVPSGAAVAEGEASVLDPKTFDLAAFVNGVRPVERGITLYQRGDLLADRDFAMTQLDDARARGDNDEAARLQDVCRELTDTIQETALDVRVQAWSSSKVARFVAEQHDAGEKDEQVVTMRLVAAQIVQPAGLTAEILTELSELIEPQIVSLIQAVRGVNGSVPTISIPF